MYGETLGDGVEYHLMKPATVVKYHLRRGVGFIKFLENGTRPQPPTSRAMSDMVVLSFVSAILSEGSVAPSSLTHKLKWNRKVI